MELLFNTSGLGGIHQTSLIADDPDNGDAYDSYVSTGYPSSGEQPGNTELLGAAVDIPGTSGVQAFDTQNIDLTWASSGGTQTGPGQFHVGRVAVADAASGSWTLKGFQGDADDPVTISGNFAEFPFGISVVEGSGTGVAGYNRYLDFFADVTTNLGAMELLLNTDSAGDVYQVSTTANDPNNGDAFDSYVSTGYPSDSEQPGNTVLLGAAVDIAGTSGVQTFTNQDVDLTWAPSGGTQTAGGRFHIGRMTLADSATGSWILKGFQSDLGGVIESIEISGTIEAAGIVHNPGDVTGEGFVGADDLVAILTNWGVSGAGVTWETGDIAPYNDGTNTGDDFIGADDYVAVLTNWGTTYPPEPGEAVPEPATIAMLALAGAALILRRCQVN